MADAKADATAVHCSLGLPGQIDAFEFARRGRVQAGVFSVHRLQRLLDGLADQPTVELVELNEAPAEPGLVRYVLVGQLNASGRPQLVLQVQAKLLLECQRCLGPMVLSIDRQSAFDLVRREADLGEESFDEDSLDEPEKLLIAIRRCEMTLNVEIDWEYLLESLSKLDTEMSAFLGNLIDHE